MRSIRQILLVAAVGVGAAAGGLAVDVTGADGDPTVTVTQNDTPVENATVTVALADEAGENEADTYVGLGGYETDASGTVDLPPADEPVTVEIAARADNESATTVVELTPGGRAAELAVGAQQGAGDVTVAVTEDGAGVANATVTTEGNWSETGTHGTDEDGYVVLEAPVETVNATLSARANGTTVERSATVRGNDGAGPADTPFGQFVAALIGSVQNAGLDQPLGPVVAEFVTATAGPPEGTGPNGESGPPEGAGADGDDEQSTEGNETESDGNGKRGPPEDAGTGDDGEEDDDGEDEQDDDETG